MKYRKLRIAWSVAWGIAAALLIALWVRSYSIYDHAMIPTSADHSISAWSADGQQTCIYFPSASEHSWTVVAAERRSDDKDSRDPNTNAWGFGFFSNYGSTGLYMPHWCPVLIATTFAAIPLIKWQFSLRALLIATTLVAVVLGLVCFASG